MTLPTQSDMEQSLLALPLIAVADYTNIASWIASSTNNIMWLTGILPTTSTVFTFNEAVFITSLNTLTPTASIATAANNFFTALETAVLASVYLVTPGAYFNTASPATTWSIVATTLPDPPSLIAAKNAAITYMSSTPLSGSNPVLANSVRIYFTTLTYTVTGTNTAVPPTPFIAASVTVY